MNRHRVLVVPRARAQAARVEEWWKEHRDEKDLFRRELRAGLTLLESAPEIGNPYVVSGAGEVRRVLLRRTRFHLYYRIESDGVVRVLAVWHSARGAGPVL